MPDNIGGLAASWRETATDSPTIDRALSRMLRELNPPTGPDDAHPLSRTSVLNLIVHSSHGPAETREIEALWELAERHPSRALVLTTDPGASEPGLDATATARCQIGAGTRGRVCCEEVLLVARGSLADHLAAVVAPLLVPDLPVVLWWLGEPPLPGDQLLRLADHLIVESASRDSAGLDGIARLVESLPSHRIVGDLTWLALAPWREHLARFFDVPEARAYQRQITTARIEYAAGQSDVQPLLLVSWLASRLGWHDPGLVGESNGLDRTIGFSRSDGAVEVRFVPTDSPEGVASGEVVAVTLESRRDERVAAFEIARDCGGGCASQRFTLPCQPPIRGVVPIAPPSLAARLGQELARSSRDASYEASLQVAKSLASLADSGLTYRGPES